MRVPQLTRSTESLGRVEAALCSLTSPELARRYEVTPVSLVSDTPDGILSNGKRAHFQVTLADKCNTVFQVVIVDRFRTRPKNRVREAIKQIYAMAQEGAKKLVTIFVFGNERFDTLIRKVANCIRIAMKPLDGNLAQHNSIRNKRHKHTRSRLSILPGEQHRAPRPYFVAA